MTTDYTAEQLQAAYDRAYADVRKEYAEDLPSILAYAGVKTVEELAWKCEKYERLLRAVVDEVRSNGRHSISLTLLLTIEGTLPPKEPAP